MSGQAFGQVAWSKWILWALAVAFAALYLGGRSRHFVEGLNLEGAAAPSFSWTSSDGSIHSISELLGKVVILHFWAEWCAPCLEEMPSLTELESRMSERPVQILALHADTISEEAIRRLALPAHPKSLIFDYDRSLLEKLDVSGIPVTFLVDKSGQIRRIFRGPQRWDSQQMLSLIDGLISEEISTNDGLSMR